MNHSNEGHLQTCRKLPHEVLLSVISGTFKKDQSRILTRALINETRVLTIES